MNEYKFINDNGTAVLKYPGTSIAQGGNGWDDYEEYVAGGGETDPQYTLDEMKGRQKAVITEAFQVVPKLGLTTSLGLRVNSARLDKDNMQELQGYCIRHGLAEITIRLYDNTFASVTIANLKTIINEIQEFGLGLYQHKWAKEAAIDAAETEADVTAITWGSEE